MYYFCFKFICMRIVARKTIVNFYQNHADSKIALEEWYLKTYRAKWMCSADIKQTFNSVDSIGNDRFVFNIKGNDYRLVALILFKIKTVYVRFIGTHAEYSKTDCTKI
jgi:mRNA interferase HigB